MHFPDGTRERETETKEKEREREREVKVYSVAGNFETVRRKYKATWWSAAEDDHLSVFVAAVLA